MTVIKRVWEELMHAAQKTSRIALVILNMERQQFIFVQKFQFLLFYQL